MTFKQMRDELEKEELVFSRMLKTSNKAGDILLAFDNLRRVEAKQQQRKELEKMVLDEIDKMRKKKCSCIHNAHGLKIMTCDSCKGYNLLTKRITGGKK